MPDTAQIFFAYNIYIINIDKEFTYSNKIIIKFLNSIHSSGLSFIYF